MISRQFRFHGHNSLTYLFRNGKTVRGEFISLKYVASKSDDYRLAVIVSKKVSKKAVVRNRIRRRVYEIIRTTKIGSNKPWSYDMSIQVFDESLATAPHDYLHSEITKLLKKANII